MYERGRGFLWSAGDLVLIEKLMVLKLGLHDGLPDLIPLADE
jgi:hypothetical protein